MIGLEISRCEHGVDFKYQLGRDIAEAVNRHFVSPEAWVTSQNSPFEIFLCEKSVIGASSPQESFCFLCK
jgi:hypothetical protein